MHVRTRKFSEVPVPWKLGSWDGSCWDIQEEIAQFVGAIIKSAGISEYH